MNTPDQPAREKAIFQQALDLESEDARFGFLVAACRGDAPLLARLQTLLRAHERANSFLPAASGEQPLTANMKQTAEMAGTMIGRYKLLQNIGEGGCGTVYMAKQEVPVRRRVALKVIKLGMDTKEVIARFEAERQALAMMDHPNIAKVLDAGATESGRPFFVMELVRGVPITKYCDDHNLPTADRLKLFTQVCHAVQHAHQKGIIHRDIKPSNILVTLHDGTPVPKVIDFGIAKATQGRLTDHTLFTAFEQFIGTPAYMSPEQAEMSSLDIDTRSDIYSLGVLLYELLTGRTPFESKKLMQAGLDEMRRQIREVEPQRPSTRLMTLEKDLLTATAQRRCTDAPKLVSVISGDLDWIVMRCLEKDRTRRYETATSLAQDLQRHLLNEPVAARPPSGLYRLQKMVARNKLAVGATAVVSTALIIGLIVSIWAYLNEKSARQFAVEAALAQKKAVDVNQTIRINAADVRRQAEANTKKAAIESAKGVYAMAMMKDWLRGADSALPAEKARWRDLLNPIAERLRRDGQISPEAKQELCGLIGDFYLGLGEFGQAEVMYREEITVLRKLRGDGHPDTTAALHKLIEALKRQGKDVDAARVLEQARNEQREFLRSEHWTKLLHREALALKDEGRLLEADAKIQEAMTAGRASRGEDYNGTDDFGLMARLRFDAGDFAGAKELAERWIVAEKLGRRWSESGTFGYMVRIPFATYVPPYDAHTILGLVALREGDRNLACEHLLQSAFGVTPLMEFKAKDVELATALVAAGEKAAVTKFLDRMKPSYVDVLESRSFSSTIFRGFSESRNYEMAATGHEHDAELRGWRMEVSAGRIPVDWQRMRSGIPPTPVASRPELVPVTKLGLGPAPSLSRMYRGLFPFAFLMIGWCAVAAVPRIGANPNISSSAVRWLVAFCIVRTLDAALFAATVLGDGFVPDIGISLMASFASWALLWEFIRALMPTVSSRKEIRFMRAMFVLGAVTAVTMQLLGLSSMNDGFVAAAFISLLVLLLLTFALAFGVCISAGWRLWRWQRSAGLTRGQRLGLKFAAVLLAAHGYVSLFAPVMYDQARDFALGVFWTNALLPWLLATGLVWRRGKLEIEKPDEMPSGSLP